MKQQPAPAVLAMAMVLLMLRPGHASAADLRVLSARVVQEPLDQLAADFAKATGHSVLARAMARPM